MEKTKRQKKPHVNSAAAYRPGNGTNTFQWKGEGTRRKLPRCWFSISAIRCSTRFQSIVGNQVKIICVFFKIELQNISIRNREWFHGPIHIQFIQSNLFPNFFATIFFSFYEYWKCDNEKLDNIENLQLVLSFLFYNLKATKICINVENFFWFFFENTILIRRIVEKRMQKYFVEYCQIFNL